jgi:phenylpropionate dioxygenase-like ring-hydroxylating dioxygenase large terminal subunit
MIAQAFIVLLTYFTGISAFLPKVTPELSIFNKWTCLGIIDHMDLSRPYAINIGDLPLVLWKNPSTGKISSTINICRHMGSKLDNGIITDSGCLKCKYHGLEMDHADRFGEIMEHEGKVFWAYEPKEKTPYKIPFYNNAKYSKSYVEIDMHGSLTDSAFNSIDLRHPEYVHNMGFGSSVPPTDIRPYLYVNPRSKIGDRVGLAFNYQSNRVMRTLNDNQRTTKNFHMFIYPTFTWSRVSFENKHLIIAVNFLPLGPKKTRWFVTLCHNYYQTNVQQMTMKMLAMTILSQDYVQMHNQHQEDALKKVMMFDHTFVDEEAILWLNDVFKQYQYPDINACVDLYKDYKNKKTL